MKPLHFIFLISLFYFVVGCTGTDSATDSSSVFNAFDSAQNKPEAKISRDGDWTIVTTTENGNRVYWFLAPDVNDVSPAMFKKTVNSKDKNEPETVIVSKCDAPKQTCDDLAKNFKTLSEKYK